MPTLPDEAGTFVHFLKPAKCKLFVRPTGQPLKRYACSFAMALIGRFGVRPSVSGNITYDRRSPGCATRRRTESCSPLVESASRTLVCQ